MEIDKLKTLDTLDKMDYLLLKNNCSGDVDCNECPYKNLCELLALLYDKIRIL